MKIRIDTYGQLYVRRGPRECETVMWCPFGYTILRCSHNCPLFGEPRMRDGESTGGYDRLGICQGRDLTGEIIDERIKGEPDHGKG